MMLLELIAVLGIIALPILVMGVIMALIGWICDTLNI